MKLNVVQSKLNIFGDNMVKKNNFSAPLKKRVFHTIRSRQKIIKVPLQFDSFYQILKKSLFPSWLRFGILFRNLLINENASLNK